MTVKHFAYGNNMSARVMAATCPRHRLLGAACLAGQRLMFNRRSIRTGSGVADVVPAPGASVWGALYELGERDLLALDRKEGHDWAYRRGLMRVRLAADGSEHEAFVYTVVDKEPVEVRPADEYLDELLRSAEELGLPTDYLDALRRIPERFA